MKAREIVFVILVVLFGLSIQSFVGFNPSPYFHIDTDWDQDRYREYTETKEVAADAKLPILFENAYGDVTIRGWDEPRISILLRKRVCMREEEKARAEADRIHIVAEPKSGEMYLGSNRSKENRIGTNLQTDFEVTIPNSIFLKIVGEHGDFKIQNLKSAGVDLAIAYGDLDMKNIEGNTTIRNDHSEISLNGLAGNLLLDDTYDDLTLIRISGDAKVKNTHGDVDIENVGGGLDLIADYGDIVLKQVAKDVTVAGDHSSVQLNDCLGNATINNSYESIDVTKVSGKLNATGDHSPVTFKDIGDAVKIQTSYDEIDGARIKGPLTVQGDRASVNLKNLEAGCTVNTTNEDVTIVDFVGKIDITAPHGSCRLRASIPPSSPIAVHSDNGDIRIVLPPNSQFQFLAETVSAEIKCRYPSMNTYRTDENQRVRVTGSSGGQARGPMVELRSTYGDITIVEAGKQEDEEE